MPIHADERNDCEQQEYDQQRSLDLRRALAQWFEENGIGLAEGVRLMLDMVALLAVASSSTWPQVQDKMFEVVECLHETALSNWTDRTMQ